MEKLSLIIDVLDKEKAKWLWECHLDKVKQQEMGIRVRIISNGDLNKRCNLLEDKLYIYDKLRMDDLADEDFVNLERIDKAIEKSMKRDIL